MSGIRTRIGGLRETGLLAGLRHPNLPRVSDYFTEGENYYLVMDLIGGQSLDKLIGPQGLPEATVLSNTIDG